MHSWCVESEKWVEICFHHWTSEKIPFLYFFLHKSWIWQTLGPVTKKNSYRHFYNASKECFWPKNFLNFMHGFKSAILAIFPFCQNGTFEPVHEIQKKIWSKDFFWGIMNVPFTKSIHNMPQGPSNPGFMQLKVQKGDFLKKPSRELKFFSCLRFLWIPRRPGTLN